MISSAASTFIIYLIEASIPLNLPFSGNPMPASIAFPPRSSLTSNYPSPTATSLSNHNFRALLLLGPLAPGMGLLRIEVFPMPHNPSL